MLGSRGLLGKRNKAADLLYLRSGLCSTKQRPLISSPSTWGLHLEVREGAQRCPSNPKSSGEEVGRLCGPSVEDGA